MSDSLKIEKVAVLGTGVMGAQIAAHLTNAKIPVLAFDIKQEIADKGIQSSVKLKPSPYYNPKTVELITPCNYDEHLDKISECDWIIEVIAERLDWKQDLYEKIQPYLKENAVLTSNTSGISALELSSKMNDSMASRFFITHFFNPPRYMKLVEIVPCERTDDAVIPPMAAFLENDLGKGVVYAKDTPNFIANRIGVYGMMVTLDQARKNNLSIENVDALTGTLIGRPKSATFRTADVVGLDTMCFVSNTAFEKCENDAERDMFKIPSYLEKMVANEWLGQKSKQGFYKKIDKGVIHSIDLDTLEYTPQKKDRYPGVGKAKEHSKTADRIKTLVNTDDVSGQFIWEVTSHALLYSAFRVGEISNDIVNIDRAMRWGFGWEMGPFEVWDAIGLSESVVRMKEEKKRIPDWVAAMLSNGNEKFYKVINGKDCYWNHEKNDYVEITTTSKELNFSKCNNNDGLIEKHWSASIVDLGDEVVGVNFHSVLKADLNPIDGSILETLYKAQEWVKEQGYKGLVVSSDSANFCAGANLTLILNSAYRKDWEELNRTVKIMQDILQSLRYAEFPVVAAPFGLVLGGGFETISACDRIVAAGESYIGLVEVGVGLIPGAGGNLRMISNLNKKIKSAMPGAFPIIQKAFETIGFAKVATSAKEAKAIGYLNSDDRIVINRDHILSEAKNEVLSMSDNYVVPEVESFKLPGKSGRLVLDATLKGFVKSGKISEHDALIGKKLGYVLTGGDKGGPFSSVDEQYLLDIERETFISLCGEQKSIERIEYMLKKGKPLRN
ncbi:MAG: 3-hydroxyacyl-CoA dehydrogenase NAD-binding domain-containing protein [Candidatus Neomarinimicrobiota bacterium]|nr:3-hydroxyacyl-CoA dehydrogenase NAD-binding domain-containing protein [Candidatus Neomarinimicrobiota bacterium]